MVEGVEKECHKFELCIKMVTLVDSSKLDGKPLESEKVTRSPALSVLSEDVRRQDRKELSVKMLNGFDLTETPVDEKESLNPLQSLVLATSDTSDADGKIQTGRTLHLHIFDILNFENLVLSFVHIPLGHNVHVSVQMDFVSVTGMVHVPCKNTKD